MALKRFVAERDQVQSPKSKVQSLKQEARSKRQEARVAIIGSGPAGLSCAHDLALMGYSSTIFEALPVAGGMLRVGIPEYRLPKKLLEEEIKSITNLGVEIKTNITVGQDITLSDLKRDYQAIFIAVGAQKNRNLNIEGEDLAGVIPGIDFLRQVNLRQRVRIGRRVAVIGGGNTAIDAARTALRSGAEKVFILYRRTFEEMPASPEEIEEAKNEGVEINILTAPTKIIPRRNVVTDNVEIDSIECVNMKLGEPDASGRRRPLPIPGSEYTFPVDTVIPAIGQVLDLSFITPEDKIDLERSGWIVVDEVTMKTSRDGIFAGGDATTGPKSVIEAIAAGKRAALSIDLYLREKGLSQLRELVLEAIENLVSPTFDKIQKSERQRMPTLPLAERIRNFLPVELGFSELAAIKESLRCLNCGAGAEIIKEKCVSCLTCLRVCPFEAPHIKGEGRREKGEEGVVEIDVGKCQACGICYTECPARAIRFKLYPEDEMAKEIETVLKVQNPKSKVQSQGSRVKDQETEVREPIIVGFYCQYGAYRNAHSQKPTNIGLPDNVKMVKVLCTAKIDTTDLLKTFELGADGVFIAGCYDEECNFWTGSQWTKKRIGYIKKILDEIGLAAKRLEMFELTEPFSEQFQKAALEMTKNIK